MTTAPDNTKYYFLPSVAYLAIAAEQKKLAQNSLSLLSTANIERADLIKKLTTLCVALALKKKTVGEDKQLDENIAAIRLKLPHATAAYFSIKDSTEASDLSQREEMEQAARSLNVEEEMKKNLIAELDSLQLRIQQLDDQCGHPQFCNISFGDFALPAINDPKSDSPLFRENALVINGVDLSGLDQNQRMLKSRELLADQYTAAQGAGQACVTFVMDLILHFAKKTGLDVERALQANHAKTRFFYQTFPPHDNNPSYITYRIDVTYEDFDDAFKPTGKNIQKTSSYFRIEDGVTTFAGFKLPQTLAKTWFPESIIENDVLRQQQNTFNDINEEIDIIRSKAEKYQQYADKPTDTNKKAKLNQAAADGRQYANVLDKEMTALMCLPSACVDPTLNPQSDVASMVIVGKADRQTEDEVNACVVRCEAAKAELAKSSFGKEHFGAKGLGKGILGFIGVGFTNLVILALSIGTAGIAAGIKYWLTGRVFVSTGTETAEVVEKTAKTVSHFKMFDRDPREYQAAALKSSASSKSDLTESDMDTPKDEENHNSSSAPSRR